MFTTDDRIYPVQLAGQYGIKCSARVVSSSYGRCLAYDKPIQQQLGQVPSHSRPPDNTEVLIQVLVLYIIPMSAIAVLWVWSPYCRTACHQSGSVPHFVLHEAPLQLSDQPPYVLHIHHL